MKLVHLSAAIFSTALLASAAHAQTAAPAATTAPATTATAPSMAAPSQAGVAAASGNDNQAIATTHADSPQPAHGANSFTRGQATSRLKHHGFQNIAEMKKDKDGVWRGTGTKDGASVQVWVDYKGNVGQQ